MTHAADEAAKLAALERDLPDRVKAAAGAVHAAKRSLAHLLTRRAAGLDVAESDVAEARKALALAREGQADMLAIERVLPEIVQQARSLATMSSRHTEFGVAARKEKKAAYVSALEALSQVSFRGMSRSELKERGRAVLELAKRAGKVPACKERLAELAIKPGGEWLQELI